MCLVAILLVGFVVKTVRLGTPNQQNFDEIYHAFTANQFLENDPDVNNPWAVHPPGNAYEWTHPHLGKWFIALSILIFGDNGFGWRFSSVLFGTLVIFLSAVFVLQILKSKPIALLTALLLTCEGLLFVQSRVSMIDIHITGFVLLSFITYWHWKANPGDLKRLMLLGFVLGLTAATKWTALYVFMIIGVDLLVSFANGLRLPDKNWIVWFLVAFILLPFSVYLLTYFQMVFQDYNFGDFVELQKQMWWYHTNLKDGHDYSSKPWQWILNLRPVYFYYRFEDGGKLLGHIYNLGNPIILWSGFVAFLFTVRDLIKKWQPELGFITIAYLLLWAPWMFSPRMHFFHHYAPAIPFLVILLARKLMDREKKLTWKKNYLLLNVTGASILWFVVFLPHLTAIVLPKWFVELVYFSLPGWK